MKPYLLLLPLAAAGLASCAPEPAPEPRVVNHYHNRTVYVEPQERTYERPRKSAPSVGSESAEGFRAVERPGSYSQ